MRHSCLISGDDPAKKAPAFLVIALFELDASLQSPVLFEGGQLSWHPACTDFVEHQVFMNIRCGVSPRRDSSLVHLVQADKVLLNSSQELDAALSASLEPQQ